MSSRPRSSNRSAVPKKVTVEKGSKSVHDSAAVYSPGPTPRTVVSADGVVHEVPESWELLPPGDAGLTRRVKAAGPHWVVQEKRGRKVFSRGIWADATTIATLRQQLEQERASPSYAKRLAAGAVRREKAQLEYVTEFQQAVVDFLAFDSRYSELAAAIAQRVTTHATPVGSGTVARTSQLTMEQKARAAVIAWMRHQTTAYDHMKIARVKGQRREVRRQLATESNRLLERYRQGLPPLPSCPLLQAIE